MSVDERIQQAAMDLKMRTTALECATQLLSSPKSLSARVENVIAAAIVFERYLKGMAEEPKK